MSGVETTGLGLENIMFAGTDLFRPECVKTGTAG